MRKFSTDWARTIALVVALTLTLLIAAGCGGGGGTSATALTVDEAVTLTREASSPTGPLPPELESTFMEVLVVDGGAYLGSRAAEARAIGESYDFTVNGLRFVGSSSVDNLTGAITGSGTIQGTLAGTDTPADGTVVDLTHSFSMWLSFTQTIAGSITPPGGPTYGLDRTWEGAFDASVATYTDEAELTLDGVWVFRNSLEMTIDVTGEHFVLTQTGASEARKADDPGAGVKVAYDGVAFYLDDDFQPYYTAGTVSVESYDGYTAELTVQPDGTMQGDLYDPAGALVGTLTLEGWLLSFVEVV